MISRYADDSLRLGINSMRRRRRRHHRRSAPERLPVFTTDGRDRHRSPHHRPHRYLRCLQHDHTDFNYLQHLDLRERPLLVSHLETANSVIHSAGNLPPLLRLSVIQYDSYVASTGNWSRLKIEEMLNSDRVLDFVFRHRAFARLTIQPSCCRVHRILKQTPIKVSCVSPPPKMGEGSCLLH